jgi:2-methylisocitrate lyase-like PEP mutase family enzyme
VNAPQKLNKLLSGESILVAPGCYDGLSARIIERLGFKVAYLTGYGIEASRLGKPDIGLASMVEVIDHARNICEAITLPVICDADTGYGDALNVWRTVREFEKTGVAGIHIEDQAIPKKCGGLPGREVIPQEEMVGKIKAARDAAENKNFIIIARSDAKTIHGIEEAKRRYEQYFNSGAALGLIAERYSIEELAEMGRVFPHKLVICTGILGWEETTLSVSEYEKMGIKVLIYPTAGLYAAAKGVLEMYTNLKKNRGLSAADLQKTGISFSQANALLGLAEWSDRRTAYTPPFQT